MTTVLSRLPISNAAAGTNNASRLVQQAAPSSLSAFVTDPRDLVALALAILAEDAEAWQARRTGNLLPGSTK